MKQEIVTEIQETLNSLYELNQMIYDYWTSHLYEDEGDIMNPNFWNAQTLRLIQKDLSEQFALLN